MGKLMAAATTVAATLTLIESATISTNSCNSLMVMAMLLRAVVGGGPNGARDRNDGERNKVFHGSDLG
jgi:hypothetical protein